MPGDDPSLLAGPRERRHASSTLTRIAGATDAVFVLSVLLLVAVIPIEVIATFGPLSLSRVVAAGSIGLLGLVVLLGQRLAPPNAASVVILALLAWICLSYFWSYAPGATLLYASRLIQLGLLVVIVWQVIDTPLRMRLALAGLASGGFVGSVYSLADRVSAHGGVPRYAIGDPNDFGLALSITLMATLHLASTSRRRTLQVVLALVAVLEAVALVRTASRTALLAAVLGAIVLIPPRSLLRPQVALACLATVAALVGVFVRFGTLPALSRLTSTFSAVQTGDFNNRGPKWALAYEYWSHAPIQGLGGGAFRLRSAELTTGTVAHSVWLGLLAELGMVGFLLFATLIVIVLVKLVARIGTAQARAVLAMEVCWLIGSLTLTLETRKVTWLLIALATSRALQAPRRVPVSPPPESAGLLARSS